MESGTIEEMLSDLLWLNALIATELIQITENTSALLRKAPPPARCLEEHLALRRQALAIAEKYGGSAALRQHLEGHR
ncbi:MAG: hypothetical protein QMD46_02695 [Methanomicrobiales archaeon]|nr:hypothetical protein [Methanomicrobiales archaeon]MDI6875348.1 hypothetical protein [Methanomicrobiales archaeon]